MFAELDATEIRAAYTLARRNYALLDIDTDAALEELDRVPISVHCWQGDDVRGFETSRGAADGGGILATGNCPGIARNGNELRADADKAFSLIPGLLRFNLHAIYAEPDAGTVERDQLEPEHFRHWLDWARRNRVALDFNPTYFAHPLADDGATLSHPDPEVQQFWIRHAQACRRIGAAMGRAQKSPCLVNHWIPDGAKDHPADRWGPRKRLKAALDEVLREPIAPELCRDTLECKLFGLGSEDFVVGSHEFYLGYGLTHGVPVCLDMGHFHPTETLHDKVSAILTFQDQILLHISRGMRWDSDHVVVFNDDVLRLLLEVVRGQALSRAAIALDFFDAGMNRIGAWVIGARATKKALLFALLDPTERLRRFEAEADMAAKLGLGEAMKTMPLGAVWDMYCLQHDTPVGAAWLNEMHAYEKRVQRHRIEPVAT